MNYEVIFYHAGRTAEIETTLSGALDSIALYPSASCAALTPAELAQHLAASLNRVDPVFIIGGLDGGRQSTDKILSIVLSARENEMTANKLIDDEDNTAYLIRSRQQFIFVLPDDADIIQKMLDLRIRQELRKLYSLSERQEAVPAVAGIAGELERQLSRMPRTVPEPVRRKDPSLLMYRILIAVLLSLGVVQTGLAVFFWLTL